MKEKVLLELLGPIPTLLNNMLIGDRNNERNRNYQDRISNFNAALGFASRYAAIPEPLPNGPYCNRIHGNVYHTFGGLAPMPNEPPRYNQLYILDGQQALDERMRIPHNAECLPDLMQELDRMLREINPYCETFRTTNEVLANQEALLAGQDVQLPVVRMYLTRRNQNHRYELPVGTTELAIVFDGIDGLPPAGQYLTVYPTAEERRQLHWCDPNRDPMVYPLLFPNGEQGFRLYMPHARAAESSGRISNVTHLEHFASERLNESAPKFYDTFV
jgi:hypothetical protein